MLDPDIYQSLSFLTDPGEYETLYQDLPDTLTGIISVIQGLFLHIHWASSYGVEPDERQRGHGQTRYMRDILKVLMELEESPLKERRPNNQRFYGNCRDYALFLTSILRWKGIPARCRCGFATYFNPHLYEDHWIVEYWEREQKRWILVDPQLDNLQLEELEISFSPLDLPQDVFIKSSKAWILCREGREDPHQFGIFDLNGLWFVRGNLIRDLASLNRVELLPWDSWGLMERREEDLTAEEYRLLHEVAHTIEEEGEGVFSLYRRSGLEVPEEIKSYGLEGVVSVKIQ